MIMDIEPNVASKEILDLFNRYKSKQFIFVEPGGNAGDYLIYKGAQKLAKIAGIEYRTVTYQEFMKSDYPSDAVIYIHGGGGCVPFWGGVPLEILKKAAHSHRGIVVLGPQTFFIDDNFLKEHFVINLQETVSKKIYIYTRDPVSFSALEKCVPSHVELALDHDTALNLCSNDLIIGDPIGRLTLYFIRQDREFFYFKDRDLLSIWLDPAHYCVSFDHWVFLHSLAKKIITNRTHSSIMGSILGIPTILLPNGYHKNRSIWEYSLKQRGVEWQDEIPIKSISSFINKMPPLKRFLGMTKIQTAIRGFYGVRKYKYRVRWKNVRIIE